MGIIAALHMMATPLPLIEPRISCRHEWRPFDIQGIVSKACGREKLITHTRHVETNMKMMKNISVGNEAYGKGGDKNTGYFEYNTTEANGMFVQEVIKKLKKRNVTDWTAYLQNQTTEMMWNNLQIKKQLVFGLHVRGNQ